MKKKLFTLIAMLLPLMASAYDAGNSLNLYSWGETAENLSEYESDSDVSKTRAAGAVNISVIFTNVSNEDIYITGHQYIALRTADGSDWGPIHVNLVPYSKGYAQYVIPKKTRAVVPSSMLDIFVNGGKEPVSKYFGGTLFRYPDGDPVYWRVYSWTSAHDPAVVKSTPGTVNFVNGGSIEFILTRTDQAKEGRIIPSSNPTVLGGGSVTPTPEPQQPEPQQPEPQQPEPQQPEPQQPEPQQPEPQQPEPQQPTQTCAVPTVTFKDGKLSFASTTEDAWFNYVVFIENPGNTVDMGLPLELGVNVCSNKNGYNRSEWVLKRFKIESDGLLGDLKKDGKVNVADHVILSDIIMEQQAAQETRAVDEQSTITFNNNIITFPSETSGTIYEYEIYKAGVGDEVDLHLPITFRASVKATKDDKSETITKDITIGMKGDLNGDGEVNEDDRVILNEIIIPETEEEEEAKEEENPQNEQPAEGNQEQ